MVSLFQEMKKYFPEDRDVNLFLGLANLARRQYQEAYQSFTIALEKMETLEKQQLLNPGYLVKNSEEYTSPEQVNNFWIARDPMFLTEENERILEHYGRFAYANLAFSVPKLKIEGWKTDRGKTYIRYGRPWAVVEYGRSMEFGAIYPPMQIWIYPQFQLAFSDEFWNGLYQFTEPSLNPRSTFKERTVVNYSLVAENVFAVLPDRFDFHLAGGSFLPAYQINFFREQDQTVGHLTFAVPVEDQLYHSVQHISAGLYLLNPEKIPINQFLADFEGEVTDLSYYTEENYLVRNFSFYPDSGNWSYSFELLNRSLNKNFVDRREILIPAFSDTTLQISDLVLARKIVPFSQPEQLIRNQLTIYPNFHRIFENSDTLFAYFEIYNLAKNAEGAVHYAVESSLTRDQDGGILGGLFSKKKRITVVNEYSGTSTSDFVIQSVDISNLETGRYGLEILVKDQVQKTTVEQKTELEIIANLNN
jgi:GWxTD domain-containing protein